MGIGDLISIIDQGVNDSGGTGEVVVVRVGRGGGSPESGIAHATGHHF
jgi:hypothetical protein